MIKLTCLLKRREGMTPAEFQAYWKNNHGPLIATSRCGSHVIRYEQNPRPLDDYRDDDDRSGYDGVTVQWFASMDAYYAHMSEDDSPAMFEDIAQVPRHRPSRVRTDRGAADHHRRPGRRVGLASGPRASPSPGAVC